MKKIYLFLAIVMMGSLLAGCASLFESSSDTQGRPTVTIVNSTGYTIYYLYVSPSSNSTWGNDVLGSSVLQNGESFVASLSSPLSRVSRYDFRALDADGDSYVQMNVQLRENGIVEFTMGDVRMPTVTIVNNTGYTFLYLYVSPSSDNNWGNDVLGSSVLRSGNQFTVTLPSLLGAVNRYDIRAVDVDRDSYTKMNVQIGANARIEFRLSDIDRR